MNCDIIWISFLVSNFKFVPTKKEMILTSPFCNPLSKKVYNYALSMKHTAEHIFYLSSYPSIYIFLFIAVSRAYLLELFAWGKTLEVKQPSKLPQPELGHNEQLTN